MAIGRANSPGELLLHVTPTQIEISSRMSRLIEAVMKGHELATINPKAAIPPAGLGAATSPNGIGSRIDLNV